MQNSECAKNYANRCLQTMCCSCCCAGPPGLPGKSAYQIALEHGFTGTEAEWLDSLKGEPGPFLSCYIEAVGNTQNVDGDSDIVFDTDPGILDTAGTGISLDASGTVFTISRAGLYEVGWSVNLSSAVPPVLIGLLEDGSPASGMSNNAATGNFASGALLNVSDADIPYTVTLHNFGAPLSVANPALAQNTAVSMRISRFSDGPG